MFRLRAKGHGYRRIANLLADQGVFTTKSSVERLVRGLPPYEGEHLAYFRLKGETHAQ